MRPDRVIAWEPEVTRNSDRLNRRAIIFCLGPDAPQAKASPFWITCRTHSILENKRSARLMDVVRAPVISRISETDVSVKQASLLLNALARCTPFVN